jgi:hypothetical protein
LQCLFKNDTPGADPGFQVRGVHLKKLRRTEGGAKMFGVFRVKNHDFTKKIIFFRIRPWCVIFEQALQKRIWAL